MFIEILDSVLLFDRKQIFISVKVDLIQNSVNACFGIIGFYSCFDST